MQRSVLFLGILLILSGCSDVDSIESPRKIFNILNNGNLYLEGRWEQAASTATERIIPKDNAIAIFCDRRSGVCIENEALFTLKEKVSFVQAPLLHTEQYSYVITEWSDTTIKAERKTPAADVEIKISLADKSAEKGWRETAARGNDTANPYKAASWALK